MSNLDFLKATYLEMDKAIREMQYKQTSIGSQICKEIYPFENGQKVLVKTSDSDVFTPAYFDSAYIYVKDYWNKEKTELIHDVYAIPKLKKVKKDGSMSLMDYGYISILEIYRGTLIIKPFEE